MVDHNTGPEHEVRKPSQEARQGERGPSMLLVLGFGLLGLVLAYFLVGWLNSDDDTVSLSVVDEAQQGEINPSADDNAATPNGGDTVEPGTAPSQGTPIVPGVTDKAAE